MLPGFSWFKFQRDWQSALKGEGGLEVQECLDGI